MKKIGLTFIIGLCAVVTSIAQQAPPVNPPVKTDETAIEKTVQDSTAKPAPTVQTEVKTPTAPTAGEPDAPPAPSSAVAANQNAVADAGISPYYDSFMKDYRLGPGDVVSIEVFAQCPNYCKPNITVPPTGRISYPLIKGGVSIINKTIEQIETEITQRLEEYIIDPQVSVSLDKAVSQQYAVLGDVGKAGVFSMTRRLTLIDALAEAGGFAQTADRKQVVLLRRDNRGVTQPQVFNLKNFERDKKLQPVYLEPGDQIVVPGKKIPVWEQVLKYSSIATFARTFAIGY